MRDLNKAQSEAYRQVEEIRGVADAKARGAERNEAQTKLLGEQDANSAALATATARLAMATAIKVNGILLIGRKLISAS